MQPSPSTLLNDLTQLRLWLILPRRPMVYLTLSNLQWLPKQRRFPTLREMSTTTSVMEHLIRTFEQDRRFYVICVMALDVQCEHFKVSRNKYNSICLETNYQISIHTRAKKMCLNFSTLPILRYLLARGVL